MESAYQVALSKADTMTESKSHTLEGVFRFGRMLKTVIDVVKTVAEVRFPYSLRPNI